MNTIDLAPLVNGVVIPLLTPVLLAIIMWAVNRVASLAHFQIQEGQRKVVSDAITNGIAFAERKLSGRLDINADDKVVAALNYILPKVPDALKSLGVTPDHLAEVVAARLPPPPAPAPAGMRIASGGIGGQPIG